MEVRLAKETDAKAIAGVHVSSWQVAYRGILPDRFLSALSVDRRVEMWNGLLNSPDVDIFVALDALGTVMGFASIQTSRDDDAPGGTGEITTIYVAPEAWGRGYGRSLMKAILGKARERGFHRLTLWVLDANQRARRFYEVAGFTPDGQTKTENGPEGVVLQEVRYRLDFVY